MSAKQELVSQEYDLLLDYIFKEAQEIETGEVETFSRHDLMQKKKELFSDEILDVDSFAQKVHLKFKQPGITFFIVYGVTVMFVDLINGNETFDMNISSSHLSELRKMLAKYLLQLKEQNGISIIENPYILRLTKIVVGISRYQEYEDMNEAERNDKFFDDLESIVNTAWPDSKN